MGRLEDITLALGMLPGWIVYRLFTPGSARPGPPRIIRDPAELPTVVRERFDEFYTEFLSARPVYLGDRKYLFPPNTYFRQHALPPGDVFVNSMVRTDKPRNPAVCESWLELVSGSQNWREDEQVIFTRRQEDQSALLQNLQIPDAPGPNTDATPGSSFQELVDLHRSKVAEAGLTPLRLTPANWEPVTTEMYEKSHRESPLRFLP